MKLCETVCGNKKMTTTVIFFENFNFCSFLDAKMACNLKEDLKLCCKSLRV